MHGARCKTYTVKVGKNVFVRYSNPKKFFKKI